MATVKQDTQVFFKGTTLFLLKGTEYPEKSELVTFKPELFETIQSPKTKKVEAKIEEKFEAPKEELLIEEPVSELKVTVEETPTPRRKRK